MPPPDGRDAAPHAPILEIEGLRKSFRSPDGTTQTILDVPSFVLGAGCQRVLVGRSGCGKTTLLHVLAGILRPDSGEVRLAGRPFSALPEAARDRRRAHEIGYVFQTFNLLQGYTALENVLLGMTFGPGADRAHAKELLVRLGLSDRLDYRPSQLSVGQQQRVAVARALAHRPSLVLADEPTGNLDPAFADEALSMIRSLCEELGAALLLVTHDRAVMQQFDDVVDLADVNRAASPAGGVA